MCSALTARRADPSSFFNRLSFLRFHFGIYLISLLLLVEASRSNTLASNINGYSSIVQNPLNNSQDFEVKSSQTTSIHVKSSIVENGRIYLIPF